MLAALGYLLVFPAGFRSCRSFMRRTTTAPAPRSRNAIRTTARLQKYELELLQIALRAMGRLTMCARQLDMLMANDIAVDAFVDAFWEGRYELFY
jgi:hypothetical protein